ncbi:hypothetical protein ACQKMN_03365 [Ureibacillus composti]
MTINHAMNNPKHKAKIEVMGMKIDGVKGQEYLQSLQEQEVAMKEVIDLFGWVRCSFIGYFYMRWGLGSCRI